MFVNLGQSMTMFTWIYALFIVSFLIAELFSLHQVLFSNIVIVNPKKVPCIDNSF